MRWVIRHIDGHAEGGKTIVENGSLVHRPCHPKGEAAKQMAPQLRAKFQRA